MIDSWPPICLHSPAWVADSDRKAIAQQANRKFFASLDLHHRRHAMSVVLPNLERTNITYLSICGYADGDAGVAAKWLETHQSVGVDCEYTIENAAHRLALDINKDRDGDLHVHVHIARLSTLVKRLPKQNGTIDDVQRELQALFGVEVNRNVSGEFQIPRADLPKEGVVNSLSGVSTQLEKSSIVMTGAEFTLSDGPLKRVKWSLRGEKLVGEIVQRQTAKVSENYLTSAVKCVESGSRAFFLSSPEEAQKK